MTNKQAIVNFMYFAHNFPYGFINKVWNGNMADHLHDKFINSKGDNGTEKFFKWFMNLDEGNKETLIDWIDKNYKA